MLPASFAKIWSLINELSGGCLTAGWTGKSRQMPSIIYSSSISHNWEQLSFDFLGRWGSQDGKGKFVKLKYMLLLNVIFSCFHRHNNVFLICFLALYLASALKSCSTWMWENVTFKFHDLNPECKVEKILKGSLDSISSPSHSVKI